MAGAAGFEPAYDGTKNRCLTTWPRPNIELFYRSDTRLFYRFLSEDSICNHKKY